MSWPRLYAIVDQDTATRHGWNVVDLGRAFLDGGATLIQVRAPGAASGELLDWCAALVEAGRRPGARVIVNDRADVAVAAGAGGVHLGQNDLEARAARRIVGPDAIVGVSTHTRAQIRAASAEPIDYVAVGPVYDTGTKSTGYASVGLDLVADAVRLSLSRPVVAIGGITLERAPAVIRAGAHSVAVISDLLVGNDPARRVAEYQRVLATVRAPSQS